MKLRNPRLVRWAGTAAAAVIRTWTATMNYRVAGLGPERQPPAPGDTPLIYSFWHEAILPMTRFGRGVSALISQHADGELIAVAAARLGLNPVRGSTTRGGATALLEMVRRSELGHLAVTPDGPRGPRRKVQLGVVAIASLTGLKVVPVGVACRSAWRAGTWDRFLVPRPGTAARFVTGPAVAVAPGLDREGLESARRIVEEDMHTATGLAEAWAATGTPPSAWPARPQVRAA